MTTQSEEIKRLVRERYGGRARQVIELAAVAQPSGDACCSPQDMDEALHIYEEGQLAELPAESIAASLGCGNPTALAGLREGSASSTWDPVGASTASWRPTRWAAQATSSGWT